MKWPGTPSTAGDCEKPKNGRLRKSVRRRSAGKARDKTPDCEQEGFWTINLACYAMLRRRKSRIHHNNNCISKKTGPLPGQRPLVMNTAGRLPSEFKLQLQLQ